MAESPVPSPTPPPDPSPDTPSPLFDENSLRADIARVWGEHGAHVDVFDHTLRLARKAAADQARLRKLDRIEAVAGDPEILRDIVGHIDQRTSNGRFHAAYLSYLRDALEDTDGG